MTGQRHDPEEAIRQWLMEAAPDQAPASLRETLEREVSHPAGKTRPWPRFGRDGIRLAGRIAATLAILAIVGTGAYVYGTSRTNRPGQGASASPTESASASRRASDSPSAAPLVGDWHMVDTDWRDNQPGAFQGSQLSEVVGLSSGGFVAFMFDPDLDKTAVFHSSDGTTWVNMGFLPTKDATVTDVTDTGGHVIAVGYAYDKVANVAAPIAWTSADLRTWSAAILPAPGDQGADNFGAQMIQVGPGGFLAFGFELTQRTGLHFAFWMSADGASWHAVAGPNLPAGAVVDNLSASSAGFVIMLSSLRGLIETWQSVDGATWAKAWPGPANSGPNYYRIGRPLKATDGTYVALGSTGQLAASSWYPVTWTSSDLTTWAIAGRTESGGGSPSSATSIRGGFIGVGVCGTNVAGCPSESNAAWTSADAVTWYRVPFPTPIVDRLSVLMLNYGVSDGTHAIVVLRDNRDGVHLLVGTELK